MSTIRELTLTTALPGWLMICFLSVAAEAQYGGGTGQSDDPYLIYTAEQMNVIGTNQNNWDKHFKLMADIDLSQYSGKTFEIIGTSSNSPFRGVFDGNGKKILRFTTGKRDYTGLFGYVKDSSAEIKNLGLINPNVRAEGGSNVGSLVGYLDEGTISNCYTEGGSISGKETVGGLVGYNEGGQLRACYATSRVSGDEEIGGLVGYLRGTINNCYAKGNVSGDKYVGGLVGRDRGGLVSHSMATGKTTGQESNVGGLMGGNSGSVAHCSAWGEVLGGRTVGGLVGTNSGEVTCSCANGPVTGESYVGGLVGNNAEIIRDCYASGSVSGEGVIGGLVGNNWWPGKIDDCYSVGGVTGTTYVGGLVGYNNEAVIRTSFWDVRTSGRDTMCGRDYFSTGCNDANGETTAEMKTERTFLNAGWDFIAESANGTDNIWSVCEGLDYPRFAWQFRLGDFDGDTHVDFADFAVFAERWLENDHPFFYCRGADLTGDGTVDFNDLEKFSGDWLAESIGTLRENRYLTIDDFESYNDLDADDPGSNRIFDTWLDGFDNSSANGAVIGNYYPPFAERKVVHGGSQSMPYSYSAFFKSSKAERLLDPPQDWTTKGTGALIVWFYGDESNVSTPMSIVLNGNSVVYHDHAEVVQIEAWRQWIIDLKVFDNVDLTNVHSIAICFGDIDTPQAGGTGKVFFDDIQVYKP
ncbi:MAG: hypothetical protein JXM79_12275 [Sedimentisphaerales bacterium]|nr:hypothetical protein [Sedimentisphaerales bacterium]